MELHRCDPTTRVREPFDRAVVEVPVADPVARVGQRRTADDLDLVVVGTDVDATRRLLEHGMVATAHYLSTGAALDVLKEGGTAVDAAICAAATMSVILPHMIGIGGDAFWMIHDAKSDRPFAINGGGTCGRNITLASYDGMQAIPHRGPQSAITVASCAMSITDCHRE